MKTNNTGQFGSALAAGVATAGASLLAFYAFAVRPWHLRWGANEAETKERLPGDDLVASPKGAATHAITINAPVADVWAWVIQIGQNRAGFYSYSWLENLFGCQLRNADRIVPEYQHLRVGDTVRLHPSVPPLPVVICEPNEALVLGSNLGHPGTWGFFLKELDETRTRLIIRGRERWRASLLYWLYYRALFEPVHFVMERRMLLGIKQRAEKSARSRAANVADRKMRKTHGATARAVSKRWTAFP